MHLSWLRMLSGQPESNRQCKENKWMKKPCTLPESWYGVSNRNRTGMNWCSQDPQSCASTISATETNGVPSRTWTGTNWCSRDSESRTSTYSAIGTGYLERMAAESSRNLNGILFLRGIVCISRYWRKKPWAGIEPASQKWFSASFHLDHKGIYRAPLLSAAASIQAVPEIFTNVRIYVFDTPHD